MEPIAWAVFSENGNIRIWSPQQDEVEKMAAREGLAVTPLYAMPQWHDIKSAPKDRRILVSSPAGELYVAHWVQHPVTSDEAFCISEAPDGTQHLIHPVQWRELFV